MVSLERGGLEIMGIPPDIRDGYETQSNLPLSIQTISFDVNTTNFTSQSTSVGGTLEFLCPSTVLSIGGTVYSNGLLTVVQETITVNSLSSGIGLATLSGLKPGKVYYGVASGYSAINRGGTTGLNHYFEFTVPAYSPDLFNRLDTPEDNYDGKETAILDETYRSIKVGKSLFSVHADNTNPNKYVAAVKDTEILVSSDYYAFGTTLFFRPSINDSVQSGAFGFFVSGAASSGYFVKIKTTANSKSNGDEYSIIKVAKGQKKIITNAQSVTDIKKNVGAVTDAAPYKIDVRVKKTSTKVYITVYVNGFKISATDSHISAKDTILPKTSKIALMVNMGTVNFDYVYALPMEETIYELAELENVYANQFAQASFSIAYGDMLVSGLPKIDSATSKKYVEEFGIVAREIRTFSSKYEGAEPKYPKYLYKNLNQSVSLLGSDLTPFKATAYLLNTSGVSSQLSSSDGTKISVVGNSLMKSDELVYWDDSINKYEIKDQMSMDSEWIQNANDAKSLSDWIKTQWSKRQRVIEISVVANPILSVGDVISVSCPYQKILSTDRFVVTNVRQSWSEGLETTITARSIYV